MPRIAQSPSPKVLLVCALLLALCLAGAAWAAIPGPEGIIHGCYNRRSGTLRVINTAAHARCTHREHELNWSEQGPAGPRGGGGQRGATGARGSTGGLGPAGPQGPSSSYAATQTGELTMSSGAQALVSIALPAGRYILQGAVTIAQAQGSGAAGEASCTVRGTPTPTAEAHAAATLPAVEGAAQTIPLDGAITLTAADTLEMVCSRSLGTIAASQAQLEAIQVATITAG